MANVHDLDVRNDVEDDAFNRPHVVIAESKVGGERDDGTIRQFFLVPGQTFPRMPKVTCGEDGVKARR
jgi:hypothetical protein